VAEFGVESFGEADEGELAGDVGEHVGHGELAADAADVDDGCVVFAGVAVEQVRESGVVVWRAAKKLVAMARR
jgi:hypothetical protein